MNRQDMDAPLILKDWSCHSKAWVLDVVTGDVDAIGVPVVCHGFIEFTHDGFVSHLELPKFLAVYASSSALWLQAGDRRWNLSELRIERSVIRDGWCRFRVFLGSEPLIDLTYPGPFTDALNRLDPAFDEVDEEEWDFCYYLANSSCNSKWRSGVFPVWREGFLCR